MAISNYFADAETDFNDADFILFSVSYEKTFSFRPGAKKAPAQIRDVSWNFESYDLRTGIDFRNIKINFRELYTHLSLSLNYILYRA